MLKTKFKIESFGISDIGLVRERNEDLWFAQPDEGCFLVADGMGGHRAGEIAAREAIDNFLLFLKQHPFDLESTLQEAELFFQDALVETNHAIHEKAEADPALSGMGTTLCALNLFSNWAIVSHVGDSRIYRLRGAILKQLTQDHSLIFELLSLGLIRAEDAGSFPYKHILTRALGTHSTVQPSVQCTDVKTGDLFLLCSDGLTNYVTDPEIQSLLEPPLSLQAKGENLVQLAKNHGGGDNITLVLVELK